MILIKEIILTDDETPSLDGRGLLRVPRSYFTKYSETEDEVEIAAMHADAAVAAIKVLLPEAKVLAEIANLLVNVRGPMHELGADYSLSWDAQLGANMAYMVLDAKKRG